jgi:hypothetical protein
VKLRSNPNAQWSVLTEMDSFPADSMGQLCDGFAQNQAFVVDCRLLELSSSCVRFWLFKSDWLVLLVQANWKKSS